MTAMATAGGRRGFHRRESNYRGYKDSEKQSTLSHGSSLRLGLGVFGPEAVHASDPAARVGKHSASVPDKNETAKRLRHTWHSRQNALDRPN
jgi:hypothetical protein